MSFGNLPLLKALKFSPISNLIRNVSMTNGFSPIGPVKLPLFLNKSNPPFTLRSTPTYARSLQHRANPKKPVVELRAKGNLEGWPEPDCWAPVLEILALPPQRCVCVRVRVQVCVCVCVCWYMSIRTCVWLHMYIYIYVWTYVYIHAHHIHIYTDIHIYIHDQFVCVFDFASMVFPMCARARVCVCVCMCVCVAALFCFFVLVCVVTYTHISPPNLGTCLMNVCVCMHL